MLAAEVTDKWEARMQPIREFRKARGDLQAEFAEATSAQRRVFGARLAKLADEHERATGQEVPEFDRRIDWPF